MASVLAEVMVRFAADVLIGVGRLVARVVGFLAGAALERVATAMTSRTRYSYAPADQPPPQPPRDEEAGEVPAAAPSASPTPEARWHRKCACLRDTCI